MKTKAQRFKNKAQRLMPQHKELQNIDDSIDSYYEINELMFRESEYIGGMAAVITALLELKEK